MANGIGCKCMAKSAAECSCDVDWTPQEIYDLRSKLERLEDENHNLKALICNVSRDHHDVVRCRCEICLEAKRIKNKNKALKGDE